MTNNTSSSKTQAQDQPETSEPTLKSLKTKMSLKLANPLSAVFLHHMASFDGPKFQMTDGSYVQTKAIDVGSSTDISPYLSLIREYSILNGNRADLSRLDSIEAKWEEIGSKERLEAATIEGWLIFNVWDQLSE